MVCSKSPGWPGPVQCRMEETKGENGDLAKWSAVQLLRSNLQCPWYYSP